MQIAVIDFARNVLGKENANSTEFDPATDTPVIHIMDDQKSVTDKGATMRLGACPCLLKAGTASRLAYDKEEVSERHRHRFEFNNTYREEMENAGLIVAEDKSRSRSCRDCGSERPSMVCCRSISSRISIQADQSSSLVCGFHRGNPDPQTGHQRSGQRILIPFPFFWALPKARDCSE